MTEQLTQQRDLYISSILTLTANMRQCAEIGENFAKFLKNASEDEMSLLINPAKRKATGAPDDEEAPKKRKRNTKPKDPNAPKRPASSYILFQNEIRKELKEKHPNLTNPELLNMISDLWKKMSEEDKALYHKAVEDAKERYSQDKKAYDNRTPEEIAAANAAVAEAAALKKSRPRKKSQKVAEVPARPLPTAAGTSLSASSDDDDSSAGEGSDDEGAHGRKDSPADSDSSEEEVEVDVKPTKKSKKASVTNVTQGHKGKKGSK